MIEIRMVTNDELQGTLFEKYEKYTNSKQKYYNPDSEPISEKVIRSSITNKDYDVRRCIAIIDGQIVGHASVVQASSNNPTYDQDKGLFDFNGFVLLEHRNRGIGSKLSHMVLGELDSAQIRSISTYTTDDAGARFCNRIGGKLVAQDSYRTVDLKDIDWELVNTWKSIKFQDTMKPVASLYEKLNMALVNEIIDLSYATNIEIKELDRNESTHTIEQEKTKWREMLEHWKETCTNLECIVIKDSAGSLIGFTLCMFMPNNPETAGQSITAVWKHHRGHGYGKLLKALMLINIRDNHPKIKRIETENNDLNAPMVAINEKLGFMVVSHYYFYKLDHKKAIEELEHQVLVK